MPRFLSSARARLPVAGPAARARRRRIGLRGLVLLPALAVALAVAGPADAAGPSPAAGSSSAGAPVVARVIFHGDRRQRVVALTFDDGYGPRTVARIFDILTSEGVPATFFVNGAYIYQNPALWRRIAAAGYPIGNHTYRHADVVGRTPASVTADLLYNQHVFERVTGRSMAPIFRPPYGDHDAVSDAAASAAGFPTVVLWDVSSADTARHSSDASIATRAASGRPGSIVLMHAGPQVTPRILRHVIAQYRARGFAFVTVPQLLGLPWKGSAITPPSRSLADAAPEPPCGGRIPAMVCGPVGAGSAPTPRGDDQGASGASASPPVPPGGVPGAPGSAPQPTSSGGPSGAALAGSTVAQPAVQLVRPRSTALARDEAWARQPGRDGWILQVTLGSLAVLLVLGALVGARERRRAQR